MTTIFDPSISYIIDNQLLAYRDLFLSVCEPAHTYLMNTVLSRSGEVTGRMYFLLDGIVKVYTTNPGGYTRILGYHKRNTLFAMDCICPGESAVVTMESIKEVQVLTVTWAELEKMDQARPGFLKDLVKYYGSVLRLMCFDAENISARDAAARLATFLCMFKKHHDEEGRKEPNRINLTQDELASAVNASRIQTARICADFRSQGLISCTRGAVIIEDPDGLMEISQY